MNETSNKVFETAPKILLVPQAGDVKKLQDPDEYLNRINEISSPRERFVIFCKSIFDLQTDNTHEARQFQRLVIGSTCGAFLLGGILKSRGAHQDYERLHNASVFENKYLGNRHFYDTLATGVVSRGLQYGFKAFFLSSAAGFISLGSMVYRAELYLPDWIIGYSALGAVSRLWIGSRGMAAGGLLGGVTGLTLFGAAKAFESFTGYKYQQIKLIDHKAYMAKRESKLRDLQMKCERDHMSYLAEAKERGDI